VYPKYNKNRESNWIGHIWCRNYLLKPVIDEKIEEIIDEKTRKKTSGAI
jgi:two-component SAPR family response regulator